MPILRSAIHVFTYNVKDAISASKYSKVDLGVFFWNRFAVELEYLVHVLKEHYEILNK